MGRIENARGDEDPTAHRKYLEGYLYFLVGSIHAVQQTDHDEAMVWFDRARPLLQNPSPTSPLVHTGVHGELLVSMGVTYWEQGRQDLALQLTDSGREWIQLSVDAGIAEEHNLSVPHGNLATMHNSMGNQQESVKHAQLASRLEEAKATRQR